MIDFIAEHIKDGSININDKIFIDEKTNMKKTHIIIEDDTDIDINENVYNEKEVRSLLDHLNYDKCIDRKKWLYIGSILKNMKFDFKLFCEYSQKMPNHEPCTCERTFKSLTKEINNPFKTIYQIVLNNKLESADCVCMKDLIDYFNNRSYEDLDVLLDDVKKKCKNTIYVFLNGAIEYVAIKKDYSYDNDSKTMELSKYETFSKNYSYCEMHYTVIEDGKKEQIENLKTISLPKAINRIPGLSYKGYYFKPYHPFENISINNNGYLNIFSPMLSKRLSSYDVSKIQMILDHIKIVWANNDDFLYRYILSYFHQIIKTPWIKTSVWF